MKSPQSSSSYRYHIQVDDDDADLIHYHHVNEQNYQCHHHNHNRFHHHRHHHHHHHHLKVNGQNSNEEYYGKRDQNEPLPSASVSVAPNTSSSLYIPEVHFESHDLLPHKEHEDDDDDDERDSDARKVSVSKRCCTLHPSPFPSILMGLLVLFAITLTIIAINKFAFGNGIHFGNWHWNKLALIDSDQKTPLPLTSEDSSLTSFERAVTIHTLCDTHIGIVEENAFAFKGIPYAVPPIGALRWSRPIPVWKDPERCVNSHTHYHHANKFGSICSQMDIDHKQMIGHEDCLYLSVWTPRLDDSANLPVMVYIDGDLIRGSPNEEHQSPSGNLSLKTNMVYVSFNYRLGVMGFLAMDLLSNSGANASHGNYGLWDTVLVLQWVSDNIVHFGGDPKRVTLFGGSAAVQMVRGLLTNCEYSNLFASCWLVIGHDNRPSLSSDNCVSQTIKKFSSVSKDNKQKFLRKTNCSTVECLRSLTAEEVLRYYHDSDDKIRTMIVIDDELILDDRTPQETDKCDNKQLLIGTDNTDQISCIINSLSHNNTSLIYHYHRKNKQIKEISFERWNLNNFFSSNHSSPLNVIYSEELHRIVSTFARGYNLTNVLSENGTSIIDKSDVKGLLFVTSYHN